MAETFEIRDSVLALREDVWRRDNPFSPDITTAHKVLLSPFATTQQCNDMLSAWLHFPGDGQLPANQPCLFGRIAAANGIEYCIINENVLVDSDARIRAVLTESLQEWKQRSVDPETGSEPAHGFMVVLAGRRIAEAAPDNRLLNLALAFRKLWGCEFRQDPHGNDVAVETLFLKNPTDGSYVRFTFSVDFFGAQGDGRWWHDHRVPGGIAFTANSAGHMARYYEWYANRSDQNAWLLKTAMLTINAAANTPYGKATWLRELSPKGQPFLTDSRCPISVDKLPSKLKGKDWTTYEGHLYSDHSIRHEFFRTEPTKPSSFDRAWLEDFSYLYDPNDKEHVQFVPGEPVTVEEVEKVIGSRRDWRVIRRKKEPAIIRGGPSPIPEDEAAQINAALAEARRWTSIRLEE